MKSLLLCLLLGSRPLLYAPTSSRYVACVFVCIFAGYCVTASGNHSWFENVYMYAYHCMHCFRMMQEVDKDGKGENIFVMLTNLP